MLRLLHLKVLIKYNDGDWKWHKLWHEAIREVKLKQPKPPAKSGPVLQPAAAPSEQASVSKKRPLPASAPAAAQGAKPARPSKQAAAARPAAQPSKSASARPKAPAKIAAAERKAGPSVSPPKPARQYTAAAHAPSAPPPPVPGGAQVAGEVVPLQANNVTDSKPRPIGKKTQPPRYLEARNMNKCSCATTAETRRCCADKRCSQYGRHDAMHSPSCTYRTALPPCGLPMRVLSSVPHLPGMTTTTPCA